MARKPTTAIAFSLAGGALNLVWFLLLIRLSSPTPTKLPLYLIGLLIVSMPALLGGLMLYLKQERHSAWSFIVLLSALPAIAASIFFIYLPLLAVGSLLALAGGIKGFLWEVPGQPHVERPKTAFLLTLLGGYLILGLELLIILLQSLWNGLFVTGSDAVILLASLTIAAGAFLLYMRPHEHELWGFLVIVMSVVSLARPQLFFYYFPVFLPALIGGVLAVFWAAAPRNRFLPFNGGATEAAIRALRSISFLTFLALLVLPPVLGESSVITPLEKSWSQSFSLKAGESKMITGAVRAETVHVTGTVNVVSCCGYSTSNVELWITSYAFDPEFYEYKTVTDSAGINWNASDVVGFWIRNQSPQNNNVANVTLTVKEVAVWGSVSMLQIFLFLYFSGIGAASIVLAGHFREEMHAGRRGEGSHQYTPPGRSALES